MTTKRKENGKRFPPEVETELRGCGWFPGRDVSAKLDFPPQKNVFPAAMEIFKEFGLLKICYDHQDCDGIGGHIQMNASQLSSYILIWNGYGNIYFENKKDDAKLEQTISEYGLTDIVMAERQLNVPCCYLGNYDHGDTTGSFDIYVTEFGEIYTGDCNDVYRAADNFDEFLIHWLQEDLLYTVTKKRHQTFSERLKKKLLFWM